MSAGNIESNHGTYIHTSACTIQDEILIFRISAVALCLQALGTKKELSHKGGCERSGGGGDTLRVAVVVF